MLFQKLVTCALFVSIAKIWLPPNNVEFGCRSMHCSVSWWPEMGPCHIFWKTFVKGFWWRISKNIWHAPLLWRLKSFGCHRMRQSKGFGCHLKVSMLASMMTKLYVPPLFDGNGLFFWSLGKGGMFDEGSSKKCHKLAFCGDQKHLVAIVKGPNVFGHPRLGD